MSSLLLLALLFQSEGVTVERRAKVVSRDTVGRVSEIQRREVVRVQGGNVAVQDMTFATTLVIRTDRKLAWVIDRSAGTFSEVTFEDAAKRRKTVLDQLADARARVAGTKDADDIDVVTTGLGVYAAPPRVEVQETGKKEVVAGRECVGRAVMVDGTALTWDVLVDPTLGDAVAYYDALAALGGLHPAIAEKVRALGGFPLKGRVRYSLFLDRLYVEEETTNVASGAIAPDVFELPKDLKRVPLPGFDPDAGPRPEKPKSFTHSFREDDIERERNPLRNNTDRKPDDERKDPK